MSKFQESPELRLFTQLLKQEGPTKVNMNLFGHLFCRYLLYNRQKNSSLEKCEKNLTDLGYDVGSRMWELFLLKERYQQSDRNMTTRSDARDARAVLEKIKDRYWRFLFGKPADSVERIKATDLQFYLVDKKILTDQFISYPANYKGYLPSCFVAGIVQAALDAAGIDAKVTVNLYGSGDDTATYFLVKCAEMQK